VIEHHLRRLHTDEDGARYRQMGLWQDRSLPEFVDQWADERPDSLAISDGGFSWTYADFRTLSLKMAQLLLDLGVQRRDVVAIQERGSALLPLFTLRPTERGDLRAVVTQWREAELLPLLQCSRAPLLVVRSRPGRISLRW